VRAESAGEGEGATFTVRLPAVAPPTPHAADAADGPPASLGGVRVLVVDDDPDALELVAAVLTSAGAETRTVRSARGALTMLETWRPDVVVSDVEMPEMDGHAFVAALRARDAAHGGRVPAVALTAYGREEDRVRLLAAGFQMHLAKPFEPAHLVTVVASLAGFSR
jgi:CheY-like chemotaxis protein